MVPAERADGDEAQQIFRVPVCEPKAAVGFSAADLFGAGRAMNAVSFRSEIDPGDDWSTWFERGLNQPEDVHDADNEQQSGDGR